MFPGVTSVLSNYLTSYLLLLQQLRENCLLSFVNPMYISCLRNFLQLTFSKVITLLRLTFLSHISSYSCCATKGVTEVLYMECYSLHPWGQMTKKILLLKHVNSFAKVNNNKVMKLLFW